MKRIILITALVIAVVLIITRLLAYQFFAQNVRLEAYLAIVGAVFLALGVYAGIKWNSRRKDAVMVDFNDPEELLSERERDVLQLLAEGNSNREIADSLYVSVNTVKTHLSNIYSKLGVRNRAEAVKAVYQAQKEAP